MDLSLVFAVRRASAILLALSLSACVSAGRPADRPIGAVAATTNPAPVPQSFGPPQATGPALPNQASGVDAVAAPPEYVRMHAFDVVPAREGEAVLLLDEKESVAIPIFIGGSEATSIRLRLAKRRYQRPLTHDLFDALMREMGAQLLKVQVDDLKDGTFLGSIFVRAGGRTFELDARPSDAIALAIGNRVPVFVACRVVHASAIPRSAILEGAPSPEDEVQVEGCPPKAGPGQPVKTSGVGI